MVQGIWSKMGGMFSAGEPSTQGEDVSSDRRKSNTADTLRFSVYMPASHEEGMRCADAMKSGSCVVINGESLDSGSYQRLTDFMDGAAYVLGGKGRRVSDTVQVYVTAPVEIVEEAASFYGNLSMGKKRTDV